MSAKFDLLGDPIPENHGKPGANGHMATAENINKVRLLLVAGVEKKRIAEELGITMPTLTKHYFHSGAKSVKAARAKAIADERAKNLLRLDEAAKKGNVTAIRELNAILAAEAIKDRARDAVGDADEPKAARSTVVRRGKKDQQVSAAEETLAQDDLLNPRVH